MADVLKAEGNKLFAAKDFTGAVEKFTQAIEQDPTNHVLYSNRSGAYASLKQYEKAAEDGTKCTELKPDWSKGWGRKGTALHGTGDLVGATDAFEEAVKLDPANASAKSGLEAVKRAVEAEARADGMDDPSGGLGSMFNDPKMMEKLAKNPKTSAFLGDSAFMAKLNGLKTNPNAMGEAMGDPRFLQVMSVLLGIDMSFGNPGDMAAEGGAATKNGATIEEEDEEMPDLQPATKSAPAQTKKAPEPDPEPEPVDEEALAAKKAKEDADAEKAAGTAAYKKRSFDEAIAHYTKAWDLHKDITYLTNRSAANFEKGDYDACIADCKQAIDYGREVYADFKIIAKAYGRMGSTYEKQGDLANAVEYYQRSLTEHRTPDILNKLRAAEKAKITATRNAYLSPEKAEEARELGNQKFKEADWPAAVEAYSEMIKRAPEDPRGYSNRAACLIKLLTFPSAVADCDEALTRDPTFIRAYLRKAQALFAMKEYNKCLDACTAASQHDKDGKNAREIQQQSQKALSAQYEAQEGETEEQAQERIQRDPDIMRILGDPVMQSILQQAKGDPKALQDHMRNPEIAAKVQKLMAAGVIKVGR
ncbi:Hsp90 cochaperone [Oleoguttula sp. CCFEE 5521]